MSDTDIEAEKITLEVDGAETVEPSKDSLKNNEDKIGFFEKYLSVWVLICMVIGGDR